MPLNEALPVKTDKPIVIQNVSVIDVVAGKILKIQSVTIVDHMIAYAGPVQQNFSPIDAIIIDGRNNYLMPALWDMHTNI